MRLLGAFLLLFSLASIFAFVPSTAVRKTHASKLAKERHGCSFGDNACVGNFPFYGGISLYTKDTDDDYEDKLDNFDAGGFAGYLAPYALALVGSILATVAVFKFVLLDY